MNTKYISSSAVKKISIFYECVARVKMLIFSPHKMKYIWYLPKTSNFFSLFYTQRKYRNHNLTFYLVVSYGSPGGTFLLITYYLLLITYHLLLITYYLLLITYYLLLITYHIIYHPYNGGKLQIYIPCNSRSCSSSCSSSIFVVDVAVSLS